MSDTTDTTDNNSEEWLTPKEVEQEFNVKLRQVYRWIERNQVAYVKANRATKVSRSGVQRLVDEERNQEVIDSVVSQVFDGQDDTTDKTLKSGITMQIVRLQTEKQELQKENKELNSQLREYDRLIGGLEEKARRADQMEAELTEARAKMSELSELRRQEALTIGQLQQQVKQFEAAQAARVAQTAPEPSPVLSSEPLRPETPKKRRWWQF
jgi:myosin heavy subunit